MKTPRQTYAILLQLILLLLSATGLAAVDLSLDDATLTSLVDSVKDTTRLGELRNTAVAVQSASARATYSEEFTVSTFRFSISSQTLSFRGNAGAVANEGRLQITLREAAYYSFTGSNVWSGSTIAYVAPQVSLRRINSDGTSDVIYFERDTMAALAGGVGIDGVAQGDVNLRSLSGTNTGNLFPGTYSVEYSMSVSDADPGHADDVEANGWFAFSLRSERSTIADPLTQALGAPVDASGGDKPWQATIFTSQGDGESARSGPIGNNQKSWMKTSVLTPCTVSFWWRVSSLTNTDFLEVAMDGQPQRRISGSVDWQLVSLAVPQGAFSFREIQWTYSKGPNGSDGEDAGWVDGLKILTGGQVPPRTSQTIQFDSPPIGASLTVPTELVATASSGLPVSLNLISGPALLRGTILVPYGSGSAVVQADQSGDGAYLAAPTVVRNLPLAGSFPPVLAVDAREMSVLVSGAGGESVEAIAAQPDGKIIVGGYFNYVGGQRRANLARFNADGTLDRSWAPEITGRGVSALVLRSNAVYVAGQFSMVNGVPRTNLARVSLDSPATVDPAWNPKPNGFVFSIAAAEDGLVAGGAFASVGGQPQKRLAKLSFEGGGNADPSWNPGPDAQVEQLSIWGTNLYFSGAFSNVGGISIPYLAKASTAGNGRVDPNWRPGLRKPQVRKLAATEGALFAGGDSCFGPPGDDSYGLAGFGTIDGRTLALIQRDRVVTALAVNQGWLYVGYGNDRDHPLASHSLIRISTKDFNTDASWVVPILSKDLNNAGDFPGKVAAVEFGGGNTYVGGNFRSLAGSPGSGLAVLPGFAGAPTVSDLLTSVGAYNSVGLTVTPNPADVLNTKYFQVFNIQHGTVFDSRLTPIPEGGFIDLVQGRLGLTFLPEPGFSGITHLQVRAASDTTQWAIYSPPAQSTITVLEKRYSQSITFALLGDVPIGAGTVQLTASASSGLPVDFSVTGPAYITPGSVLVLTGVGTVQVTARQAGNEAFEPSVAFSQTFQVTKDPQTLQFLSATNSPVNMPLPLQASASSGLPVTYQVISGPASLTGDTLTFADEGLVVVRALQPGNDRFAAASIDQFIQVTGSIQTITFPPVAPIMFNGGSLALNASASTGLPVTYVVISGNADVHEGFLYPKGAGPVVVEARQAGNDQWPPASARQTILFTRGIQTLSYESLPALVYVSQQFKLRVVANSGLPVTIALSSGNQQLVGDTLTITSLGFFTLIATQPGSPDYEPAQTTFGPYLAKPGFQTIAWDPIGEIAFDQGPLALTAKSSAGLPVSYRILAGPGQISDTQLILLGIGVIQVQAYQNGNELYQATAGEIQAISVRQGSQRISFAPLTNLLAGKTYPLAASASSGLAVSFGVASGPAQITANGQLAVTGAGAITVVARQNGNGNYLAVEASQTVEAVRSTQSIDFQPLPAQPWNAGAVSLNAASSSGLPVIFELVSGPATIASNLLQPAGVGEAVVRARQAGNEAYAPAEAQQSIQLTKAGQTVQFAPLADVRLSDAPQEIHASASSGSPVELTVLSGFALLSNHWVVPVGLGPVVVQARQPGNDLYEAAASEQRAFNVSKGIQTIQFSVPASIQAGSSLALQATASSGLPVEFGIFSGPGILSNGVLRAVSVGTIVLSAMQSGNENYEPAPEVEQSLRAVKASQTIEFPLPATALLGDGALPLAAKASSGLPIRYLVLSGPAFLDTNLLTPISAGTVTVRAVQSGDDRFEPAANVDRSVTFVTAGPQMRIRAEPAAIIISWPALFADHHVESSETLSDPAWKPAPEPIVSEGESASVRLVPGDGNVFYRLNKN